jgi:hypothetical protein
MEIQFRDVVGSRFFLKSGNIDSILIVTAIIVSAIAVSATAVWTGKKE